MALDPTFFAGGWQSASTLKMIEEGWSVLAPNTALDIRRALAAIADTGELGAVLRQIEAGNTELAYLRLLEAARTAGIPEAQLSGRLMDSYTHGLRSTMGSVQGRANALGIELGLGFRMVNEEAVRWAATRGAELVVEINEVQRAVLRGMIETSQQAGIPPARLARNVRNVVGLHSKWAAAVQSYENRLIQSGLPRGQVEKATAAYAARLRAARALNIARTETLTAQNAGQHAVWKHLQDLGHLDPNLTRRKWIVTKDDKLCPWCKQMIGERAITDINKPFSTPRGEVMSPPMHPSCFPAGTVVEAQGIQATTKRWYEGDLVEIETRSGQVLSVTPNHPLLTRHGWAAAGSIQQGDEVVRSLGSEWVLGSAYDDYQPPSLIEEVLPAFGMAGSVSTMKVPVSGPDFHGDGFDSEVEVVRADSLLSDVLDTSLCEHHAEVLLGAGAGSGESFDGLGLLHEGLDRHRRSSYSSVRSSSVAPVLFGSSRSHAQSVGVGERAHLDALGTEPLVDRSPRHAEFVRELLHTGSSQVALDEVVRVNRYKWEGHVYNLETVGGWYISNGIIAHNCRCAQVLDVVDVAGLMLDEGLSPTDWEQWLEPVEKGDYQGHPFRGNQHVRGRGGTAVMERPSRTPVPDDAEPGWGVSRRMVDEARAVIHLSHGEQLRRVDNGLFPEEHSWRHVRTDQYGNTHQLRGQLLDDDGAKDVIDRIYQHRYDLDQEAKATVAAGQNPNFVRMLEDQQDGRLHALWERIAKADDGGVGIEAAATPKNAEAFQVGYRSYEDFRESVGNVLRSYAAGRVTINLPVDVVDKIVYGDGRIKSQFETDTSGGMLSPTKRKSQEEEMLGLPQDMDPAQRPIYGSIRHDDSGRNGSMMYGTIELEFGSDTAARATVSIGDTLGYMVQPIPVQQVRTASAERLMAATAGEVDFVSNYGRAATEARWEIDGLPDQVQRYREVFERQLRGTIEKSYAEAQILGQVKITDAVDYRIHATQHSDWLLEADPTIPRYADKYHEKAYEALQTMPNLRKGQPIARRGELLAYATLDPDVVEIVNERTGETLGEAPWPGALKFGYWTEYLGPETVIKHLPGQHDQKSHGRRGAGGPGSAPRIASAGSAVAERRIIHEDRTEAEKGAQRAFDQLAKEYPKTAAHVRLEHVDGFAQQNTAARLSTGSSGATIQWNYGRVLDFRKRHELEDEPMADTMRRIVTHEFGHALHNQALSTLLGAQSGSNPSYGEHNRLLRQPITPDLKLDFDRAKSGGPTVSGYAKQDHAEWFAESFLATKLGIGNANAITGNYVRQVVQWAEGTPPSQPDAYRIVQGILRRPDIAKADSPAIEIEEDFEGSLVADPWQGDQLFERLLRKEYKTQRDGRKSAAARGYDRQWRNFRAEYMGDNPVCENKGCTNPAEHLDHIDGLGPNAPRGRDPKNLRKLCHSCHSKKTVAENKGFGREPVTKHLMGQHDQKTHGRRGAGGGDRRPSNPSADEPSTTGRLLPVSHPDLKTKTDKGPDSNLTYEAVGAKAADQLKQRWTTATTDDIHKGLTVEDAERNYRAILDTAMGSRWYTEKKATGETVNRDFDDDARLWYTDVHNGTAEMAKRQGIDLDHATAVVAALSPGAEWSLNVRMAETIVQYRRGHPDAKPTVATARKIVAENHWPVGHGYSNIARALSLVDGDIDSILNGPKVRSFYNNIRFPDRAGDVTIDVHMQNAARGGLIKGEEALIIDVPKNKVGEAIAKKLGYKTDDEIDAWYKAHSDAHKPSGGDIVLGKDWSHTRPEGIKGLIPHSASVFNSGTVRTREVGTTLPLAEAVRKVTSDWNRDHPDQPLLPHETQAIIWTAWSKVMHPGAEKRSAAQKVINATADHLIEKYGLKPMATLEID